MKYLITMGIIAITLTGCTSKSSQFGVSYKDVYGPNGYEIVVFKDKDNNSNIIGTTLENKTGKLINLLAYPADPLVCPDNERQIKNIKYCVVDDIPGNSIKKGIKWEENGIRYDLSTTDEDLPINELYKISESVMK